MYDMLPKSFIASQDRSIGALERIERATEADRMDAAEALRCALLDAVPEKLATKRYECPGPLSESDLSDAWRKPTQQ